MFDTVRKRIAVVFFGYYHEYLQGIYEYAREANWSLKAFVGYPPQAPLEIDGIVAYHWGKPEYLDWVREQNVPTVSIDPGFGFPSVVPDMDKAGRLAARHLVDEGFENIGFFSPNHLRAIVQEVSFKREVLESGRNYVPFHLKQLPDVLHELPKPIAISTVDDGWAEYLYSACTDNGISVPEQVAILGMGNGMSCEMSMVPLSSLDLRMSTIGYEAARLLSRMINHGKKDVPDVIVSPGDIVVRESTGIGPVADPVAARAVKLIHRHFRTPINLSQLAESMGCCRKTLENRFKESMGKTMSTYLNEIRMEDAGRLIKSHPKLRVNEVARMTGFQSRMTFLRVFKKAYGKSPREYRSR